MLNDRRWQLKDSKAQMTNPALAAPRCSRCLATAFSAAALLFALHALAAPVRAQSASSGDAGLSVRLDWLQATALPLDRSALHSGSVALQKRVQDWTLEAGWLRVARSLSTVQGGFAAISRPLLWRDALVLPGLGVFGGGAEASRDTTGYNWVGASPTDVGHVPRYSHSRAASFGGGVTLGAEYPARTKVAFRAAVSHWVFSSQPLTGDRQRTLAGIGLAVRFGSGAAATRPPVRSGREEDQR